MKSFRLSCPAPSLSRGLSPMVKAATAPPLLELESSPKSKT
jgi:hypothetical protein